MDKAHPYSRRAKQARRALHREDKLQHSKMAQDVKKQRVVDKIMFFASALDENTSVLTPLQIHDYIMSYIQRNDSDIQQLINETRPGRPRPNRLELLEMLKAKDLKDYQDGIELPDLTDAKNVSVLKAWDGDFNSLSRIKMKIYTLNQDK